ncbi:hypothetical protein Hamer_G025794 [Xyrichtys novacula]|uniref:Reverse transcriptase n=1 Tax=Xyrichtys novacula TaxID=13765 RepID=A0AAV1FR03_XYRNO|nr:hypothetical protein Hamer_G025794 [Xyrichtys novacula]
MQRALDTMSFIYSSLGLAINTPKTEVMIQERCPSSVNPVFSINGTPLQTVQQFCYLGSMLTPACHIDHDIEARINLVSAAFGRLRSCVFENRT